MRVGLRALACLVLVGLFTAGSAEAQVDPDRLTSRGGSNEVCPTHVGGAGCYTLTHAECVIHPNVVALQAYGRVETTVKAVNSGSRTYYQEVRIWVDHQVLGGLWRNYGERNYSWGRFRRVDLPKTNISAIRTLVGSDHADAAVPLRLKWKVKLRRVNPGPDRVVWQYTGVSTTFYCPSLGGVGG
jgi:hypothetical protein